MPVLTKINTNSIAEDAITGDKFAGDAYLANTATQNISGTYSENRMYTSDAYTLSGNATINSNVVLSSVKADDSDIVLTAGGAYTITGTGKLEAGSMYGRNTVSGMTGELGSVVTGSPAITGSPALNLGNATFPGGHIIQIVEGPIITGGLYNTESWGEHNTGSRVSITPTDSNSKIYIIGVMTCYIQGGGNKTDFRRDIGGTVTMPLFNSSYGRYMGAQTNGIANHGSWNIWGIDSPHTTSTVTYSWASLSTTSPYNSYTHKNSQITLMEIKG